MSTSRTTSNDEVPILALRGVEAAYGSGAPALSNISLTVPKGAVVALLGANGAGKTTAIRSISGLMSLHGGSVTGGEILLDGMPVVGLPAHRIVANGLAQVPEGRKLFPNLTITENLLAGASARSAPDKEASIESVFELFPTLKDRRHSQAGWLSGGEQQMVAIGRALMAHPNVMLLDEVSLGLAPKMVEMIFAKLDEVRKDRGCGMLVVEQNANLALAFADHAYVMEGGRIVIEGPAEMLRSDPHVQELYLGGAPGDGRRSFASAKRYQRLQQWLS